MDLTENTHPQAHPRQPPDTPEVMLKRVFAVAEILAKAKSRDRNEYQSEPLAAEKTQDDETVVS